jgi:hypothetical protein
MQPPDPDDDHDPTVDYSSPFYYHPTDYCDEAMSASEQRRREPHDLPADDDSECTRDDDCPRCGNRAEYCGYDAD